MKYWAFLSYSHTDKKWGDWLHRALETYRVPRRLVGKDSRDGKVPERVYPIFRDREELPVSADLGSNINEALQESRYLIVICSPRSAQSRWVGEEIKTFKKLGREDRILALIVDGEPNASEGKPGFKVEDECFHEAMRYRMVDGEPSEIRSEPIAADAREVGDGKTNAKLKLLAGLLGVNYDDLKQREQERRLKRARMIAAASVALIAIFAALSVALFFNARAATRARDEARATLSQSDFLQALTSINDGKDLDALARLSRSLKYNPKNHAAACRLATLLAGRNFAIPRFSLEQPNTIRSAEFSPDGKRIVTATAEWDVATSGEARIWDAETGRPLIAPMKHDLPVRSAKFSPNGRRVLTISAYKRARAARLWDAATGIPLTESLSVRAPQFSPDSMRLIALGTAVVHPEESEEEMMPDEFRGNRARMWDAETGKRLPAILKDEDYLHSVQFSPDGNWILTRSDNAVRVWNANSGSAMETPIRHNSGILSAEFSPDGKRILTVSQDKTMRVWDAQSCKQVVGPIGLSGVFFPSFARFSRDGTRILTSSGIWSAETGDVIRQEVSVKFSFSPDESQLVAFTEEGQAQIWDAATGKELTEPMKHDLGIVSALFSPDGKCVVTASGDKTARVWKVATGNAVTEPMKHAETVNSAQFSPDGARVLTVSSHVARVWDLIPATAIAQPIPHDRSVIAAEFSPDGKRIVTASEGKKVRVWDSSTGKAVTEPMEHDGEIAHAQFSRDGRKIITASEEDVLIWDSQTGQRLTQPIKHTKRIASVDISSDSKRVVTTTGEDTAQIWDTGTGRLLTKLMLIGPQKECHIFYAEFSPDGKHIVTAAYGAGSVQGPGYAQVWDAETGKATTPQIPYGSPVVSARFSPDGKQFVTVSGDLLGGNPIAEARVWSTASGRPITAPMKHDGAVVWVDFSHDGKRLVTASYDKTARLWDAKTGSPLTDPMKHNGQVLSVAFSQDDQEILTVASDHTARIWEAHSGAPLTEPTRYDGAFTRRSAQFSAGDKRILTVWNHNTVRVIDVMPSEKKLPSWVPELTDAMAGQRLSNRGFFEPLSKDSTQLFSDVREQLSHEPAEDEWAIWGRWFLADRSTRTISPFSKITVPEYIEDRIKENTAESLDEAEQLAVGNPELLRRIRLAKESLPPKAEQKEKEQQENH